VRNIGTLWNTLPSVVGEGAINAANAVLGAIDDLISKNRAQVASYLIQAGSALGPFGAGLTTAGASLATSGGGPLQLLKNPLAGSTQNMMSELGKNAADVDRLKATDGYTGLIGDRARAIDTANALASAGSKKGAAAGTNKSLLQGLKAAGGALDELQSKADKFASTWQGIGGDLAGILKKTKTWGDLLMDVASSLVGTLDFSMFGGQSAGVGSLIKGLLGGLTGFANGGSGVVAGSGGTDSQLFMAKVTPGEPYAFGDDAVKGRGGPQHIHVTVGIDDEGKLQAYVTRMGRAAVAAAVSASRQSLPGWQSNMQKTGAP
jgi:hypothetical protein